MRILALALTGSLFLASCGGPTTNPPKTTPPKNSPGFSWVDEPLQLWQKQSIYNMSYWANRNPLQLSSYFQQSYVGNNRFVNKNYSLTSYGSNTWREDRYENLIFDIGKNNWAETDGTFTATEGPVGSAGVKTVYVTDATGTRYYSLEKRDLTGKSLLEGLTPGFGDGRLLPDNIKDGSAKFSANAEAYTWVMDLKNPVYAISRIHYVFTENYELLPVKTCTNISDYCYSGVESLSEAISKNAWILNGGGNVSVQLKSNGKAEVVYKGEDGKGDPQTFTVNYAYSATSPGAPERIVFDELKSSDNALTQQVAKAMALADTRLAFYSYNGEVVRGTYTPVQTGVRSQAYQYNKQAINDILTQWTPQAPPVAD